jgi:large subunit ribosomal protein L23
MALFGSKKAAPKEETAVVKKVVNKAAKKDAPAVGDTSWVIVKPRITEKAALMGDKNIYVFEVARRATKTDVINAVVAQYKVTPRKVNIVNRMHRTTKSRARNRTLTVSGMKKAHVYLKKGDTINLI